MKNKKLRFAMFRYVCCAMMICATMLWASNAYPAESGLKKENFIIAIDAGHSEYSPGTLGARGTKEHILNRKMAGLLNQKLIKYGFKKSFILKYDGRKVLLKSRVDKIESSRYDALISIHHDSVQPRYMSTWIYQGQQFNYSDRYKGFSIFIAENTANGRASFKLAGYIADELVQSGLKPSLHHAEPIQGENRKLLDPGRGIYDSGLAVLNHATAPAILIECGIIVNREEERLLNDPAYQNKLASRLARGIVHYFEAVQ